MAVADDDDPTPQACNLPGDAITVAEVTGWRDALGSNAAAGIKRWNRVLATFGEDTGQNPMTAELAWQVANWLGNTRWDRTARTLEAMEQCDNPPPATPEISISAGSGVTEGSNASFTITASPTPASVPRCQPNRFPERRLRGNNGRADGNHPNGRDVHADRGHD